jgi:hypothetical protein
MSNPPTQALGAAAVNGESQPRHRARKRRKHNHVKDSIYLAPTTEPYALAIKQRTQSPGPSTGYAPIDETETIVEPAQNGTTATSTMNKGKAKRKANGTVVERNTDKNPRYREGAMKAWATKRQRQKERFEELEASNSLLALGLSASMGQSRDLRDSTFISQCHQPKLTV